MGDLSDFINRPNELRREAASNLFDHLFGRGLADTRATPSKVIDQGKKRTLYRYEPIDGVEPRPLPLLPVPPLAAPARAFDLRRGCSMAEYLVGLGYRTYLVDYGSIDKSDKGLGVEHWHDEVVPASILKVSEDVGGKPVQVAGWCLGGLMSLCALAITPDLPVNTIATVGTPWDTSVMPILAPMREGNKLLGGDNILAAAYRATSGKALGKGFGAAFRAAGGVPASVVDYAFKMTNIQTYAKKPMTTFQKRDDRDFLAHVEAVDSLMGNMQAYPGESIETLYRRFFIANELMNGKLVRKDGSLLNLANVRVPVMNIAGTGDVVVPQAAAHAVSQILPNAAEVRLETAPGGHLGVLAGRSARKTTWHYIDEFMTDHARRGS
ncbi:alpha/beta fold hydrolase [Mycobacterium sp. OTB74]|jgi:polyhydroxyalkanoate synthase|uniref:alpha/beta fold hydrolase n=1 Tax=Mycobacterium sp. OTB74 TaxID=1853452 RepID=UPI0024758059|nr:alpha/beta fold hydrolase [Mycobacterium sp. OTB74]